MSHFQAIVTHKRPHLDEICAIVMLKMKGEEKFPGIKDAMIHFEGAGGEKVRGLSAEALEARGILCVGVGGGKFDEHPGPGVAKKNNECASTLVAKALGIENDPAWEKILRFVKNSDLYAYGNPFDLAQLIKALHYTFPKDPQKVFDWALLALEAKYNEQQGFLTASKEVEQGTTEEQVQLPCGKTLKLVTGITENENFSKAARSKGAAIVIQQQPSGNVQIFIDKKISGLTLYDVAAMLRMEEAKANGRAITTNPKLLRVEGKVLGAEEWFFHEAGQMLLNGSLTTPCKPTKLSLERIREIVKTNIPG